MKIWLSLFLLISLSTTSIALAQIVPEKVHMGVVQKIREEGIERSHIVENARYLTDVVGPRLTGTPAMKRASEWAAQKMQDYGLENVHLEAWEFGRGWEEVSYFGRMTAPFVRPLSGRSLAWTGSTKGVQSGPAVIVRPESKEDLNKYARKIEGAWILLDDASEPRNPRFEESCQRYPCDRN